MNVYTDYQGLQYFNAKQKLNSQQVFCYLHMCGFSYHNQYLPGSKIGKLNGLSRGLGEEKLGMDAEFFDEGPLMDLENDNAKKEEDVEEGEFEGIDVATWDKKNGF